MTMLKDPRAIALLLAASLTILSNATISPALPGIEAHFAGTPNAALVTRLLVTAPALLIAICAPFAGLAADRFGRKRQLLAGVALFAISGSAGLWLDDLYLVLASRLVLGVAVAAVMTAQAALLGDIYSGAERGRFMGYQMAAVNFGGFIFIAIAGWMANIAPMLPFSLYIVGLFYLPFLIRVLPDGRGGADPGNADLPAGEGEPAWRLTLSFAVGLSGLTFVLFYAVPTQMPYYLAATGHPDPSTAGLVMACVVLAAGTVALFFGALRVRFGRGGTPAMGFAVMAAGFWVLHLGHSVPVFCLGAAILGAGLGIVMPNFVAIALDIAPAHRRGATSGAITTSIFLGQFISPLLATPLIGIIGYSGAFQVAALLLVGLVPVTWLMLRRPARAQMPA